MKLIGAFVTALFLCVPAKADVVYTYTGPDFNYMISGQFTDTEHVTGTLTFASPLPDNPAFQIASVVPLAFSFSDGAGDTVSSLNGQIKEMQTDVSNGHIDLWNIDVVSGDVEIKTVRDGSIFDQASVGSDSSAESTSVNQQFSGPEVVVAVPEPSTWAMMILGIAGIGAMAYRRRKTATLAA